MDVGNRFKGVWTSRTSGVFLIQAAVEDLAGNIGCSALQGFSVLEPRSEGPSYRD